MNKSVLLFLFQHEKRQKYLLITNAFPIGCIGFDLSSFQLQHESRIGWESQLGIGWVGCPP